MGRQPKLVAGLLRQASACLPEHAEATLPADRGLAWPAAVVDCGELGWRQVLRLQGQTRVRTADGRACSAADLAPQPGQQRCGAAVVFKKSGWRAAQVAACWEGSCDGPWLLVSDRPDGVWLFRRYAQRIWTEELFGDEKSSRFQREKSHVTDPVIAARLVRLMAPVTYLALGLGSRVIQAGLRQFLESRRQRMLSRFQIGLRWMMFCLTPAQQLVPGPVMKKVSVGQPTKERGRAPHPPSTGRRPGRGLVSQDPATDIMKPRTAPDHGQGGPARDRSGRSLPFREAR